MYRTIRTHSAVKLRALDKHDKRGRMRRPPAPLTSRDYLPSNTIVPAAVFEIGMW